jgi:hypothetical protein
MWHACLCRSIPKYFWWKPEGKRQLGRTALRWKVAVKMDLKEAAYFSEEA